ncbi:uncharacterized protein LOC123541520 [Mercenaria mercenaria]|uniref:uncharacterized protein LOC123541520 n=1 Tax=Mercenaria mercenaria TaxID=6596 RepID=UPI00234E4F50|nr:uncharacterized protein LOC123541520 [Mercenaria mercenaria]
MEVTHFTVPAVAYPRYKYTREHVTPLLKRFKKLSQKCNVTDPFPIPVFGDVNIYTISDDNSSILSIDEVAPKSSVNIQRISIKCKDVDDFRRQCPNILPSVCVASYKRACQNGDIFGYFGRYNVLIAEDDEQIETKTPEYKTADENITCVKSKSKFAPEMGLLLERILFRELYKRVEVLTGFSQLDPTEAVFSTLDQDIEMILKKRFDKSRSVTKPRPVSARERDVIHLHYEWCIARLAAIRNKISSEYGKCAPEVRKQLLDLDVSNSGGGRNVRPLKICEHIIPYLHDDTMPSGSKQIPESLSAQIKVIQNSQEITRNAVDLETRFKSHLELVHKHRGEISQLYGESMGMYHRSRVPEYERPQRMKKKPPSLSENVANRFLSTKGVTGCGYRFQTLDVYIKDTLTEEERQLTAAKVTEIAEKSGILEYQIRTEQENVTKFADYGVGLTISSQQERRASLGGFALKGESRDLSLLVARHLADDGKPLYVCDTEGRKSVIAYVLQPSKESDRCGSLDIAAASVLKKIRPNCDTMFKDRCGTPLASQLTQFEELDVEWLKGLPVHIWGAASSPGLGTIIIPDFYVEGMKRLVKIEDSHPEDTDIIVPFCKSGDSGAIVCADDPDGDIVHVISMVIGSSNFEAKENNPKIKGEYLSIRLKDGLLQLEEELKDTFRLC